MTASYTPLSPLPNSNVNFIHMYTPPFCGLSDSGKTDPIPSFWGMSDQSNSNSIFLTPAIGSGTSVSTFSRQKVGSGALDPFCLMRCNRMISEILE